MSCQFIFGEMKNFLEKHTYLNWQDEIGNLNSCRVSKKKTKSVIKSSPIQKTLGSNGPASESYKTLQEK